MKITEEQQEIVNKAINLLEKYDKEEYSGISYYFTDENDDNIDEDEDYNCCNKNECIERSKKELKKLGCKNPGLNPMGGDYDRIYYCYNCNNPLNGSLTWIESELNHHIENNINKKSLQISSIAFEIRVMFESFPSLDHEISEYAKSHSEQMKKEIKWQKDFVDRVINYAKQVIAVLDKEINE